MERRAHGHYRARNLTGLIERLPYDNAAMESFFALLKRERVYRRPRYESRQQARTDLFDYIERFYNRQRRHGAAGGVSPMQYEAVTLNRRVH